MTALDAKVRATGLIAYKAVIDHAIVNGLSAPASFNLDNDHVAIAVADNGDKWADSIHVDSTRVAIEHDGDDTEYAVYATGRLPLLGVKVQLRFTRPMAPARLRAVRS